MANDDSSNNQPQQATFPWNYLLWALVFFIFTVYLMNSGNQTREQQLSYTQFKEAVRQDKVATVTFKGRQLTIQFKPGQLAPGAESTTATTPAANAKVVTLMPEVEDANLMPLLEQYQVNVQAQPAQGPWWAQALVGILPWVLLLGLFFFISRRMQERMMGSGSGGMFGFSKSKARRFRHGTIDITFDDVAGQENAKRDLQEVIDYLKAPERFRKIGAKIPKGILLLGPPGTGKTLCAKAMAGEADVPFYSISGSEFIEMFVGVGAARVRDMFQSAKNEAPAIIFIDEIDSVGRARGTGLGGGHDEREQTLNQILNEMDGFSPHEAIVVLAATNRPDVLDPALLRPGRFDRKVVFDLPMKDARIRILEVHTRSMPLEKDVDLSLLASRTVGFSGADLENLVNEAALLAAREDKEEVDMDTFEQARDKIVLGAPREGVISPEEKETVAYHEAGHALVAWYMPGADPLDKVTIIPRGQALGATEQLPGVERHNFKQNYLLARLSVMLGGRVAEQLIFGEVTSGAESDLEQATKLARRMVCRWGMSKKLGPVAFQRGQEHVFLGRELAENRDFSEHTARLIDEEICALVAECELTTQKLLDAHLPQLRRLAQALLEHETLNAAELNALLEQQPTPRIAP